MTALTAMSSPQPSEDEELMIPFRTEDAADNMAPKMMSLIIDDTLMEERQVQHPAITPGAVHQASTAESWYEQSTLQ